jgi:hypothetical protein
MRPKFLLTSGLVFSLFFIAVGDRILPSPMSDASRNLRASMNQTMLGLFPQSKIPDKIEEREKKVEDLWNQKSGSKSD